MFIRLTLQMIFEMPQYFTPSIFRLFWSVARLIQNILEGMACPVIAVERVLDAKFRKPRVELVDVFRRRVLIVIAVKSLNNTS